MVPSRESQQVADRANATLASAILGSVTALTMGLAGGLAVRTPRRGAVVGLGASAVGALAGAAAAWALIPILFREFVPDSNDLLAPILIHAGIWAPIGALAGVAFAAGAGAQHQLPVAGLSAGVGGFTASILFHVFTGVLLPLSNSSEPVGGSPLVRLLAASLVTILASIGAARGTLSSRPPPSEADSAGRLD
jgi:hypothetical protein